MPVGQTLDAGAEGAAFGLFPIVWIVVNAIWIHTLLERSGYFAVIKRSFGRLSDDERVQAGPRHGAAAVGMAGQEGDLFRRVVKWSLILLAAVVVIVHLQSTSVLSWMVVGS